MERMGEGQRFVTRVLAERGTAASPDAWATAGGRVLTPR
jgi:hypothetical protein